ncbi:hypothetical protein OAT84_00810 [Gammaproteobacteria bacterium]|nr:hypothetical protein [Gammaproteobacteria bacterium]
MKLLFKLMPALLASTLVTYASTNTDDTIEICLGIDNAFYLIEKPNNPSPYGLFHPTLGIQYNFQNNWSAAAFYEFNNTDQLVFDESNSTTEQTSRFGVKLLLGYSISPDITAILSGALHEIELNNYDPSAGTSTEADIDERSLSCGVQVDLYKNPEMKLKLALLATIGFGRYSNQAEKANYNCSNFTVIVSYPVA